jgi:predicted RNA-binding Zn ribbon-like protein
VNFDSHTSDVVSAAVGAINLLTPGYALGRKYRAEVSAGELALALRPQRAQRVVEVSGSDVEELRDYAVRLRKVFTAVEAGSVDNACERLNAILRETQAVPVLSRHDGEPWHLHFHAPDAGWATSWAASMATALAVVLGSPVHDRLGICTALACDRVYVDTSRNGTRRFCSTSCQNRVKAAAFRARQRVT